MRLEPEMMVPNEESLRHHCHVCYSASSLQCCTSCKLVRYCSTACKEADLSIHQYECKALSPSASVKRSSAVPVDPGMKKRIVAGLVWQRMQLGREWSKAIMTLLVYEACFISPGELATLTDYLCRSVIDSSLSTDAKLAKLGVSSSNEIRNLYTCVNYNSIKVVELYTSHTRLALSSVVAMLNHSCDPNVAVVFSQGPVIKDCLHVVAIKEIKSGEELFTRYTDSLVQRCLRQVDLQRSHHFLCSCTLCVKDIAMEEGLSTRVNPRQAFWCGRPSCSGWVNYNAGMCEFKGLCTNCKQPGLAKQKDVFSTILDGMSLVERLREGEWC